MRVLSTAAGTARHGIGAIAEAAVVVAIGAALVFGAAVVTRSDPAGAADAYAAKGGNGGGHGGDSTTGGGATAVIVVPDGVFGGTTTATANPGGSDAWVHVRCYQGGGVAMEAYVAVDGASQATIQLGPTPSWSGGEASCEAEEGYWANSRWRVLAATTFNVSD